MDRAACRQLRCLLRQHLFQPQMAQQNSEHDFGTLPAEKRDLQSKTNIAHKTQNSPARSQEQNLDLRAGLYYALKSAFL